jgi:hypothetical protein
MTSAGVAAGNSQGAPARTPHAEPRVAPLHDAVEAALCRRARRQALWLLIASSAVMITLIVSIWLSFR